MHLIGFVSILLLTLAWRWWQELAREVGGQVVQGVLLAAVTVGWFLRIVLGEA